jgi:hypothetical protein
MEIWEDRQANPVADEVGALVAVAGPVITGVLRSVSSEVTSAFGDRDRLPLKMLGRLRKEADGDCGIAFEYSVHDAVISRDPIVAERVADALDKCGITGSPSSILFAMEKSGAQELISTEPGLVTDNSPVLLGEGGRPVSLRDSLTTMAADFRLTGTVPNPAQSIRGRWKTELFLGSADKWVSASVNVGRRLPTAARELRIAVIPAEAGHSDAVVLDDEKNVVVCPIPRDGTFMRVFHDGWKIVQNLCMRNFDMPSDADIPSPLHREVARIFAERREFPIMEVVEATRKFAQPGLLTISTEIVSNIPFGTSATSATSTIITPIARTFSSPAKKDEMQTHQVRLS